MTEQEARDRLREIFPPGSTAYTVLRHVSSSGMTRWIDVYAMGKNGGGECSPLWVSGMIAAANIYPLDHKREALKIGGCGMDMGFAIVYDLAGTLYGHVDQEPDDLSTRDKRRLRAWRKKEAARYAGANTSGGYAISHRWQ